MKELMQEYEDSKRRVRELQHELQKQVYADPVGAVAAGAIRLTFNFPVPGAEYRHTIIELLLKRLTTG